jgi:NADH:ubiquinone reductase (H+-translocating)
MNSNVQRPRVVIVGAGFGGLAAAQALRRAPVEVLVVDRTNHHLFQPLLYQVATAALEPADIGYPVRAVLRRQGNARFLRGEVTRVDWAERRLRTVDERVIDFDHLVLAVGAVTADFGVPGVATHAHTLKSLEEATTIRAHVLEQFEAIDRDPAVIGSGAGTFVVVGAGPTGVELAGALSELIHTVMARDLPDLDVDSTRVVLVEGADRVLGPFDPRLSSRAREHLSRMGVEVLTGRSVTRVTPDAIELDGGEQIATRTVVWAAGVRANPLAARLGLTQERSGRLVVDEMLQVPGHRGVWVVGDLAAAREGGGALVPQVAPAAVQQGRHVAAQIVRSLRGEDLAPFRYRDKGAMATIGRHAAVAQLPIPGTGRSLHLSGIVGWALWLVLHLMMLIGFRNRLSVLLDWTWSYMAGDRAARLVLGRPQDRRADRAVPSLGEPDAPRAAA